VASSTAVKPSSSSSSIPPIRIMLSPSVQTPRLTLPAPLGKLSQTRPIVLHSDELSESDEDVSCSGGVSATKRSGANLSDTEADWGEEGSPLQVRIVLFFLSHFLILTISTDLNWTMKDAVGRSVSGGEPAKAQEQEQAAKASISVNFFGNVCCYFIFMGVKIGNFFASGVQFRLCISGEKIRWQCRRYSCCPSSSFKAPES
jgi:hypothetical protein